MAFSMMSIIDFSQGCITMVFGIGSADIGNLAKRGNSTVIVDGDAIENSRSCFTGTDMDQFIFEMPSWPFPFFPGPFHTKIGLLLP